jgi:hypothetical protein
LEPARAASGVKSEIYYLQSEIDVLNPNTERCRPAKDSRERVKYEGCVIPTVIACIDHETHRHPGIDGFDRPQHAQRG